MVRTFGAVSSLFRSIKFLFLEKRIRVRPEQDLLNEPFADPGVDLLGDDAEHLLSRVNESLTRWFAPLSPGIELRSVSLDWRIARVLATSAPPEVVVPKDDPRVRPMVNRIDPPQSYGVLDLIQPFEHEILEATRARLRLRQGTR
ncbi:MAG: hypothetical protein KBF88_11105 [Polyangiaceae bacterium]|nr:hypothetical protein [Polyangiaceae bacterium]